MARHARYAHRLGIVSGLELVASPAQTAAGRPYAAVTVNAGVAIDGTGREIVVPSSVELDPASFRSQINPQTDPSVLYPVFLTRLDRPAPVSANPIRACNASQSTRMQDNSDIAFGTPARALHVSPPIS